MAAAVTTGLVCLGVGTGVGVVVTVGVGAVLMHKTVAKVTGSVFYGTVVTACFLGACIQSLNPLKSLTGRVRH